MSPSSASHLDLASNIHTLSPTAGTAPPQEALEPLIMDGQPVDLAACAEQVDLQLEDLGVSPALRRYVHALVPAMVSGEQFTSYEQLVDAIVKTLNRVCGSAYPLCDELPRPKASSPWSQTLVWGLGVLAVFGQVTGGQGAPVSGRKADASSDDSIPIRLRTTPPPPLSTLIPHFPYNNTLKEAREKYRVVDGVVKEVEKVCAGGNIQIVGPRRQKEPQAVCSFRYLDSPTRTWGTISCARQENYTPELLAHELQHAVDTCRHHDASDRGRLKTEVRALVTEVAVWQHSDVNGDAWHGLAGRNRNIVDGLFDLRTGGAWNSGNPFYRELSALRHWNKDMLDTITDFVRAQAARFDRMRIYVRFQCWDYLPDPYDC